jgi:hypothetical protein
MGSKHTYAGLHSGGEAQMRISTAIQSDREGTTGGTAEKHRKPPNWQASLTANLTRRRTDSRQKRKQQAIRSSEQYQQLGDTSEGIKK